MEKQTIDMILIDDNKTVLRFVEHMLAPYHLNLSSYTSAQEGLDAVVEHRPKVVFVDLMMPEINGDEVIIKLSEAKVFKDCTIFLLTGKELCDMDHMKLMTLGFMKILLKPLAKNQLLEIVEEYFPQNRSKAA